tara:strand:+ start:295 stop:600 length:306 start_codon:yes stop_codon:yes gene_type:complete
MFKRRFTRKDALGGHFIIKNINYFASKNAEISQGELKNPFENRNKHIRSKGPTPKTKRTIFAVLGVVAFSEFVSKVLEVSFFLDFLLGILENRLKDHNSSH